MPFGSIFKKLDNIYLVTADDKTISFKNNFLSRLGFSILGMPHIGLRLRARKIMHNLPSKQIDRMLDAGCGTGIYSFSVKDKANMIAAIDISKEKIMHAKKISSFKNIDFQTGDICNLKFSRGFFNLIICSDVLEHIKNDRKALSELSRVLKKDGILLLTLPFDSENNRKTYRKFNHERAGYTLADIKDKMGNSKLKIIRSEYYSYTLSDKLSNFSYKFTNNKMLLGIIFYPIYFACLLLDSLKIGEPNGLFIKLVKE